MIPERTKEMLAQAVESGGTPAVALGVVNAAGERDTLFFGHAQLTPEKIALQSDFYWDLASLTKPLFTARNILRLVEQGKLDLDDPLRPLLPEMAWMQDTPLKTRTIRQLLTHSAGLHAWGKLYTWGDPQTVRARFLQEAWEVKDAGPVVYSDIGYVFLGRVLEKIHGQPIRAFALDDGLAFAPPAGQSVATEHCAWRDRVLRGETHDENAASMGGQAGHAGLFGTLDGVLGQAELLLRGGWLGKAAQAEALRPQVDGRTLIFVTSQPAWSGGSLASPQAVGHTGFTGTGIWVDPTHGLAWVLLTNRVHPTRHSGYDIQGLRRAVGNTLLAHLSG